MRNAAVHGTPKSRMCCDVAARSVSHRYAPAPREGTTWRRSAGIPRISSASTVARGAASLTRKRSASRPNARRSSSRRGTPWSRLWAWLSPLTHTLIVTPSSSSNPTASASADSTSARRSSFPHSEHASASNPFGVGAEMPSRAQIPRHRESRRRLHRAPRRSRDAESARRPAATPRREAGSQQGSEVRARGSSLRPRAQVSRRA